MDTFNLTVGHLLTRFALLLNLVGATVPLWAYIFKSLLFLLLIHLPSNDLVRLCQQAKKERKKNPLHKSFFSPPQAQSSIDVFQLHSRSITETFAEIMIKALASCHFDQIRDILASFSLCYQLSKFHTAE